MLGIPAPLPCTPRGIVHLLRRYEVEIAGANVVVIGRGVTVGRPLGLLLTRRSENATVTVCHTATRHLPQLTQGADIIVAAVGVPHMVTAEMVRAGAAVVDVGVSRDDEGRLVGDVHPDVWDVAGYVSPNPGGWAADSRVSADQCRRARGKHVSVREFARKVLRGQWPILLVGLIFIAVRPGGCGVLAPRRTGDWYRRRGGRRCGWRSPKIAPVFWWCVPRVLTSLRPSP